MPGPIMASSSRSPQPPQPGSIYRFGFDVVYEQMKREPGMLDILVSRLGSSDSMTVLLR